MDEKSKAILAGYTGKRKQSRLAPHSDLICKLHWRGCTFRGIVRILSDNFSLTVAPSTVCRLIARLEKEEAKPRKTKPQKVKSVQMPPVIPLIPKSPAPVASPNEVRQRIAALKQQEAQPEPDKRRFEYDPDKPLHLVQEDKKS